MKQIAVLLTVFNRKTKTLKCLENLFRQQIQDGCVLKVYLTDDGCTDGTPEEVSRIYPQVHIIKGDGTLFWNRGMWMAWDAAAKDKDYDYYLWLNDDTFLYDGAILRLLSESAKLYDKRVIVGTTCAVENKNKITYGGWGNNGLFTDVSVNHECGPINGNIVLVPQSVYRILGKNDYHFRHATGDIDYGLRAKEQGIPCITAVGIYGECDLHEQPAIWMDPSKPFKKRWKNFLSPLGSNPFEFFYFKRKHFGLMPACIIFISNWLHFFFPWIWKSSYKNYSNG